MQVVDAATTMGLLFGAMGVGAFIGPVGFNMFTPPKCAQSKFAHSSSRSCGSFHIHQQGIAVLTVLGQLKCTIDALPLPSTGAVIAAWWLILAMA